MDKKKYFAFISYSHKDSEIAKWLQHEFEYYELPAKLFEKRKDLCKEDIPNSFRPIFRDEDELSGGELKPQISEALADSEYLIVVCSPNSAQSLYVDSEVKEFISLSNENKRRIFPLIVDGRPHQDKEHKENECFPQTLIELSENKKDPIELIAGDIHATGRDHAFVKILAGTLSEKDVRFADLWDRYAIEKAEKERKDREYKERLQITQSRFIAEKVIPLVNEGNLSLAKRLSLESLPHSINNPNRPYVAEAEKAIRYAIKNKKAVISAHKSTICSAFFVDNDNLVVSASYDNTIKVWDVSTQIYLNPVINGDIGGFDIDGFISVSPSPDGKFIVSTSLTDAVQIWDLNKGVCVWCLKKESTYYRCANFSPSGREIVVTSLNDTIEIWSIKEQERLLELKGHTEKVIFAEYNSDGSKVVSASEDKTIRIWDINTGICSIILSGHTKSVNMAKYSPDDKLIASASDDNTIRIWNPESRECVKVLDGHTNSVKTISFNTDGSLLISTSIDGTARIWNLYHDGICVDCIMPIKRSIPTAASFSPLNKSILVAYDNGNLMVLTKTDDSSKTLIGHTGEVVSSLFSSDGRYIVSASWDKTVAIWDSFSGELLQRLKGHSDDVLFAVFSPNGKQVASASRDKTIRIWDFETGKCIHVYSGHQGSVICVNYSSDGKFLVSSSNDKTIRLWDNLTGVCIKEINTSPNHAVLVTIDRTGWRIISSMNNYETKVWDFWSGETVLPNEEDNDELIQFLLTPDKKYIVGVTNGEPIVKVWERKSEICILMFIGHREKVWSFAFNPQGDRIVSASSDKTIKIWDFPTLQTIIDETRDSYKDYPLSIEERTQYYLE